MMQNPNAVPKSHDVYLNRVVARHQSKTNRRISVLWLIEITPMPHQFYWTCGIIKYLNLVQVTQIKASVFQREL